MSLILSGGRSAHKLHIQIYRNLEFKIKAVGHVYIPSMFSGDIGISKVWDS